MRNLSDEQVEVVAREIVEDYLFEGVEYIDVVAKANDFTLDIDPEFEPDSDDFKATAAEVERILRELRDHFQIKYSK